MPECRRHIFLVPLKTINEDFLDEVKTLGSNAGERFLFLLSIQDHNSYLQAIEVCQRSINIKIIRPEKFYDRTEHWEYVTRYAHENIIFDTFSYYFFGDELRLESFPELDDKDDIYINDYCIDRWDDVKENTSHEKINALTTEKIIRQNLVLGKPLLAPLQKMIFLKKIAPQIVFDNHNSYVCDQLMLHYLIAGGNRAKFIKSPFYKINNENRSFSGTIKLRDVVKQQTYLYIKLRCFIGLPIILLRTLVKFFFK